MEKMLKDDLENIIAAHKLWIKSNGKKGTPADLSGANLSGIDLSEVNLMLARLAGVNFSGANLLLADLSQADLSGANLSGADLSGADLLLADFSGADLSGADLSVADLSGANLSRANLQAASLPQTDLSGADFSEADLSRTDLSGADLSKADLSKVNFSQAYAAKANFTQANLSGANFLLVSCNEAEFAGAVLDSITIDTLTMTQISPTVVRKFHDTFQLIELDKSQGFIIIRDIELPPPYYQAGLALINYFAMFLAHKYPGGTIKIRVEFRRITIAMIIETQDESVKKQIEELFEIYGLIIQGKLVPDALSKDKKQVRQLEDQISHSQAMLESAKQLLLKGHDEKNITADIEWLRDHLGKLLQHPDSQTKAVRDIVNKSVRYASKTR